MSEWQKKRISDFCDITRGGSPRPIQDYLSSSGTPWVKISDATASNNRYISSTKEFIRVEGEAKSRVVNPGDFILSNSATPGLPRFMKIRACIHDGWLLIRNIKGVDELFLYYLLLTEREALLLQGNGSIFTNLKTEILKEHIVNLPPLEEQKAIVSVLSSLDDKIDLLHRQKTTLERMAETLFRKWFVEEAHQDWQEKPLSSIANFLNGLACQKFPPNDALNKLPVLKIKELSSGISENSDWVTSNVKPEYIVENGDVIFAWSASLMVKVWDGEKCVLNQHLFKVTSKEFPKWFYLQWCKYHLDEFISISSSHATTMGHIKRGDLDTAMVKVPKPEQLNEMTEQMAPLLEKQIINAKQIKTLEKLRDNLLPKLMSGEVRVEP